MTTNISIQDKLIRDFRDRYENYDRQTTPPMQIKFSDNLDFLEINGQKLTIDQATALIEKTSLVFANQKEIIIHFYYQLKKLQRNIPDRKISKNANVQKWNNLISETFKKSILEKNLVDLSSTLKHLKKYTQEQKELEFEDNDWQKVDQIIGQIENTDLKNCSKKDLKEMEKQLDFCYESFFHKIYEAELDSQNRKKYYSYLKEYLLKKSLNPNHGLYQVEPTSYQKLFLPKNSDNTSHHLFYCASLLGDINSLKRYSYLHDGALSAEDLTKINKTFHKLNPLFISFAFQHYDFFNYLIQLGADTDLNFISPFDNLYEGARITLLEYATIQEDETYINTYLSLVNPPNESLLVTDNSNETALHAAIKNDNPRILERLLQHYNIEQALTMQNVFGYTILHLAIQENKLEHLKLLTDEMLKELIDQRDIFGRSALEYISNEKMKSWFVEKGFIHQGAEISPPIKINQSIIISQFRTYLKIQNQEDDIHGDIEKGLCHGFSF